MKNYKSASYHNNKKLVMRMIELALLRCLRYDRTISIKQLPDQGMLKHKLHICRCARKLESIYTPVGKLRLSLSTYWGPNARYTYEHTSKESAQAVTSSRVIKRTLVHLIPEGSDKPLNAAQLVHVYNAVRSFTGYCSSKLAQPVLPATHAPAAKQTGAEPCVHGQVSDPGYIRDVDMCFSDLKQTSVRMNSTLDMLREAVKAMAEQINKKDAKIAELEVSNRNLSNAVCDDDELIGKLTAELKALKDSPCATSGKTKEPTAIFEPCGKDEVYVPFAFLTTETGIEGSASNANVAKIVWDFISYVRSKAGVSVKSNGYDATQLTKVRRAAIHMLKKTFGPLLNQDMIPTVESMKHLYVLAGITDPTKPVPTISHITRCSWMKTLESADKHSNEYREALEGMNTWMARYICMSALEHMFSPEHLRVLRGPQQATLDVTAKEVASTCPQDKPTGVQAEANDDTALPAATFAELQVVLGKLGLDIVKR